jgi:uncharacterized protein (DUF362 family)
MPAWIIPLRRNKSLHDMDRRKFLGKAGGIAAGLGALYIAATVPGCGTKDGGTAPDEESVPAEPTDIPTPQETAVPPAGLVVVKGANMLHAGLEAWGGLEVLNMDGKKVLIKVNGAFARPPEDATTTNPDLVAEAVRQCLAAGASRVTVFDHILQDLPDQTMQANGIAPAVQAAGAELVAYAVRKPGSARAIQIPGASALPSVDILEEIFLNDLIINMPKAKHHGGAGLSLSMKNFIGVTKDMGRMHGVDLHQAIAELSTVVRPALVITDATNILLDHGPGGPGKVANPGQVIIGRDPVAVDSYACGLFGKAPSSIGYISHGERLGLGTTDYASLGVKELST